MMSQVRPYDADAITRIQMPPPPLPISWGRTVQPYEPQQASSQRQAAEAAQLDGAAGAFQRTYQACSQPSFAPFLFCCLMAGAFDAPTMRAASLGLCRNDIPSVCSLHGSMA